MIARRALSAVCRARAASPLSMRMLSVSSIHRQSAAAATAPNSVQPNLSHQHPVSNPTLVDLESRWETMTPEERLDVTGQLEEREKLNWNELTQPEKRALWYISYGSWGPRRPLLEQGDGWKIFGGVIATILVATVVFAAVRQGAGPLPRTMNKEWQEATNEKLKAQGAEPFSGIDAVQSKPKSEMGTESGDDDDSD